MYARMRTGTRGLSKMYSKERVKTARSKLEDALEKSKAYFLEEANSILNTLERTPGRSVASTERIFEVRLL